MLFPLVITFSIIVFHQRGTTGVGDGLLGTIHRDRPQLQSVCWDDVLFPNMVLEGTRRRTEQRRGKRRTGHDQTDTSRFVFLAGEDSRFAAGVVDSDRPRGDADVGDVDGDPEDLAVAVRALDELVSEHDTRRVAFV